MVQLLEVALLWLRFSNVRRRRKLIWPALEDKREESRMVLRVVCVFFVRTSLGLGLVCLAPAMVIDHLLAFRNARDTALVIGGAF